MDRFAGKSSKRSDKKDKINSDSYIIKDCKGVAYPLCALYLSYKEKKKGK